VNLFYTVNESTQSFYDVAETTLDKIENSNRTFVIIITQVVLGAFFVVIEQYNARYAASAIFNKKILTLACTFYLKTSFSDQLFARRKQER